MREIERLVQEEKAKIVAQTAKIPWKDLEKFYAQGKLILVSDTLNIVDVGYSISLDDATKIIEWMEQGLLVKEFNNQAKAWHNEDAGVWSVVIHPWVLVQSIQRSTDE
jgi:hypothetical protein